MVEFYSPDEGFSHCPVKLTVFCLCFFVVFYTQSTFLLNVLRSIVCTLIFEKNLSHTMAFIFSQNRKNNKEKGSTRSLFSERNNSKQQHRIYVVGYIKCSDALKTADVEPSISDSGRLSKSNTCTCATMWERSRSFKGGCRQLLGADMMKLLCEGTRHAHSECTGPDESLLPRVLLKQKSVQNIFLNTLFVSLFVSLHSNVLIQTLYSLHTHIIDIVYLITPSAFRKET